MNKKAGNVGTGRLGLIVRTCTILVALCTAFVIILVLAALISAHRFEWYSDRPPPPKIRIIDCGAGRFLYSVLDEVGPLTHIRQQLLFLKEDLTREIVNARVSDSGYLYIECCDKRDISFDVKLGTICRFTRAHTCSGKGGRALITSGDAIQAAQEAVSGLGVDRDLSALAIAINTGPTKGSKEEWSVGFTPQFNGIRAARGEMTILLCAHCGALKSFRYLPFPNPCKEKGKLMDANKAERIVLKLFSHYLYPETPQIVSSELVVWEIDAKHETLYSKPRSSRYCWVINVLFSKQGQLSPEGMFVIDAETGHAYEPRVPSTLASLGRRILETLRLR